MSPKTFGSVRRLPSGRFEARYRPLGAQHFRGVFDEWVDARRWLDVLELELLQGVSHEFQDVARVVSS